MSREVRAIRLPTGAVHTSKARRSLDERVFVRSPAVARAVGLAWSRLPFRSRLRRALLLRFVSQAASAVNRRDFEVLFTLFDPEMTLTLTGTGMFPPDLRGEHRGYAGYREAWRRLLEAFGDMRLEPEELIDCGNVLVSTTRMSGHGGGSGVPAEMTIWQVFWLRDGLVARQEDFVEREEALKAAGLAE